MNVTSRYIYGILAYFVEAGALASVSRCTKGMQGMPLPACMTEGLSSTFSSDACGEISLSRSGNTFFAELKRNVGKHTDTLCMLGGHLWAASDNNNLVCFDNRISTSDGPLAVHLPRQQPRENDNESLTEVRYFRWFRCGRVISKMLRPSVIHKASPSRKWILVKLATLG